MTEEEPHPPLSEKGIASIYNAFLAALQFLTITPPIIRRRFTPQELGRSVGFYPLVGILLGIILEVANHDLRLALPAQVSAALALSLWVILSGGLHLDGFLDSCDGLFGGCTAERRLEIMRDERVGAFALTGGILLLLVKYSAIASLPGASSALLLAPTLGRWGMSLAVVAFPYGRSQGLGLDIKNQASWNQVLLAGLFSLALCILVAGWAGLAALGGATLTAWLIGAFALHRLPGLTGDIYGAINELVEAFVLILMAALSL
jgi:adenosylcobinamide-GDP ribazoletransferase